MVLSHMCVTVHLVLGLKCSKMPGVLAKGMQQEWARECSVLGQQSVLCPEALSGRAGLRQPAGSSCPCLVAHMLQVRSKWR